MSAANTWETSVNDLIHNFLKSINSLIPAMQASRILDDKLLGYDDWARICDNLYSIMVVEPIRESLPESDHLDFDLPMYNTEYETLKHFSLIQVNPKDTTPGESFEKGTAVLNCFVSSGNNIFDEIERFNIDDNFQVIENSYKTYPADSVTYTCLLSQNGDWQLIDKITSKLD